MVIRWPALPGTIPSVPCVLCPVQEPHVLPRVYAPRWPRVFFFWFVCLINNTLHKSFSLNSDFGLCVCQPDSCHSDLLSEPIKKLRRSRVCRLMLMDP